MNDEHCQFIRLLGNGVRELLLMLVHSVPIQMLTKSITIAMLLTCAIVAGSYEESDYEALLKVDIWDENVSNETINALIQEGFTNQNHRIAHLTLRAMGELSRDSANGLLSPQGQAIPMRTFSEVENLKSYLIDLWYQKFQEIDYDVVGLIEKSTASHKGEDTQGFTRRVLGLADNVEVTPNDIWDALNASIPPWTNIPFILSLHWKKDEVVHRLIWHRHTQSKSPGRDILALVLLNAGEFNSEKDDAHRTKIIESIKKTQPYQWNTHVNAVEGLRFSIPETSLQMLFDIALENPVSREKILIAVAKFDDKQLEPHKLKLSELFLSLNMEYVSPVVRSAYSRVQSFVYRR